MTYKMHIVRLSLCICLVVAIASAQKWCTIENQDGQLIDLNPLANNSQDYHLAKNPPSVPWDGKWVRRNKSGRECDKGVV
jgi:hypothetical protein